MPKVLPRKSKGDTRRHQALYQSETHLADAKFYTGEGMVPEALPKEIKSTGIAAPKKQKWQAVPKKQEGEIVPSSSKNDDEPFSPATIKMSMIPSKGPNTPVFRYIPMLRRKNGQSPFETGTSKANT
ncbi:hypothetical protein EV2_035551 [Malus domestica]